MEHAKILIVEDDENTRKLYVDILTQEGLTVDYAEDGEKGLEKMKKGGWDLILLDIILPETNGLEIARRIKQDQPLIPNKSIVFTTNLYEDTQYKEAMELGDGYLVKSNMTPDVFLREVKKYM